MRREQLHSSRRSRSSRSSFLLHDQVRMANIASTASVASLNFWSAIVTAARIASTPYATNATHNRFITPTPPGAKATRVGGPVKTWCTGEDSNLRSSQGAADLQSAAINHSATCARFDRASCSQDVPESQNLGPESPASSCQRTLRTQRHRFAVPAKLHNSRATILPRAICVSGSCCWNQFFSRRAARLVWLAPATPQRRAQGHNSGAGEGI